ncbi:MAG: altronate dehydratase family protein, partial [Pseudomonadota bacterium]
MTLRLLTLNSDDDVALAVKAITPGESVAGIEARDLIPAGHKMAIQSLNAGQAIRKYGQIIGLAKRAIFRGEHVHTHNLESGPSSSASPASPGFDREPVVAKFAGYARPDGRVATRNYIGVLSSVNCSAHVVRKIADAFPDEMFANHNTIDGVVALTHTTGCGIPADGEAAAVLDRVMAGYAAHPNFGGLLIIGLGCEVNQVGRIEERAGGPPLRRLTIQDEGGTLRTIEAGKKLIRELIEEAGNIERASVSVKHLTLGLQCGGSDGWSGVTANPALGRAADMLVAAGGTVILSETPEIYGAESLLLRRAVSDDVRDKLNARLAWWQEYVIRHGSELNNNPSPGTIAGGLTTILEKSLGAVAKSGSAPLQDVFEYGERIDRPGFVFMDSPGYDPCSATGQMASGANILAFTTGRGSVFGSRPAPCIKLASNQAM